FFFKQKTAYEITKHPSRREMDMLLTAGERITMSLLSLSLMEEGIPSISFTGSQSGIITDEHHGNARILKVNAFRIHEELAKDKVVIVAGFQGVSQSKEITTLGRGGSDTSAVALACYLGAAKCEIYTDVDGVYSADPRIVPKARLLREISYPDMLALSFSGSKVLHPRAVEFAYKYRVPVEVKSSFSFEPGTMIQSEQLKENDMEERTVTAIAHKSNLISYLLPMGDGITGLLDKWHHEVFKYVYRDGQLELFVETKYESEIDFILTEQGLEFTKQSGLGYVILIGIGIGQDPGFLSRVIKLCGDLNPLRIDQSERSLEIMLSDEAVPTAVTILHNELIGDNL
ncbi:MAG TPA: aspartate kinase, partial [Candidatus Cloacimonadota bacterium]|nr:aspartate kinase [Candidatus Cloacimonadota bacterium]